MKTESPSIRLVTQYNICAAHKLFRPDWSDAQNEKMFGHCTRLHGHEYRLEVMISGPINPETGMLINGYELDEIVKKSIFNQLDHHYVNDDIPFFRDHLPTAEWIAVWCYRELKNHLPQNIKLDLIRLFETSNLAAEFAG